MRRLLAVFAGLLGFVMVPLALSVYTSWMLVPVHLGFTLAVVGVQLYDGLAGRGARVRGWLAWFLVGTFGALGTLQVSAWVREVGVIPWPHQWWLPLAGAVCWSWMPLALGLFASGLADRIADSRARAAVRRRRKQLQVARPSKRLG